MKVIVILNDSSGSSQNGSEADSVQEIRSGFSCLGVGAEVMNTEASKLKEQATVALDLQPDVIVAAGGDGTVSAVASVLAGTQMPLGVLPLGTLNHFAKDLGIPLEIESAIQVIQQNHIRSVDIGRVNEHTFVNNSSIGVYPWVVKKRDEEKSGSSAGKYIRLTAACAACLYEFPLARVRMIFDEDREVNLKTPFIFIGNNEYEVKPSGFGNRTKLNAGKLCVHTVRHDGCMGLLRLTGKVLRGKLEEEGTFETDVVSTLQIDSEEPELTVALDGEVMKMKTPLQYSIEPQALKVMVCGDAQSCTCENS